jgi:cbb3-type cytochrome c oxidase subunit III
VSTWRALFVCVVVAGVSGCSEKTFDPPDRDAQIGQADSLFRVERFDTMTWVSGDIRASAGNAVYAARCRNCHGTVGAGDTDYARNRGLEVPSLVKREGLLGENADSVRHRIYVGHAAGMPTWGVAGITPREIDAVTFYLLERLRPEILGTTGG